MSVTPLLLERRDGVAIVTIDDPPYNRLSLAFMDALEGTAAALAEDDGVRAVVLTGAGGEIFSVGMNLKELPAGIAAKGSFDALLEKRRPAFNRPI